MTAAPHILILGGGYAGFHAARGLRRAALSGRVRVTVVEPRPYMTYKPLLPEVAGGHTQPRDVTVDLSRPLSFATVVGGTIESVDCRSKTAVIRTLDGTERATRYDHVVFALGAVTKAAPISGLAEHAVGFESLEEAVFLRNHVLDRIQSAASTTDAAVRNRALSFVFVGGGYTGVEAMAELQDLASRAHASYPTLDQAAQHWILVEAAGRIATELPPSLSDWTLRLLRRRGITVKTNTEMRSCENGIVHLTDGTQLGADTIVWAAGVTPNPELDRTNAPRGSKGHVQANARLQVIDNDGTPLPGAWAIGDNAEIPTSPRPHNPHSARQLPNTLSDKPNSSQTTSSASWMAPNRSRTGTRRSAPSRASAHGAAPASSRACRFEASSPGSSTRPTTVQLFPACPDGYDSRRTGPQTSSQSGT